ncbi:hypothetical protein N9R63_04290 [Flavobacteriaceae bacterium]|nr:hypothetical protein [Flavobacteriaceae bacterium]MDA9584984.1 hypothetical protein [Flavobacteriaceae bacterium]MDB2427658.1 hypothetical protein [Flavobacteriaceae bacterium]
MKKEIKDTEETAPSGITRKDAIKKMGKYAALTALGTFMILNPKKAQASSASPSPSPSPGGDADDDTPPAPPGWGG